MFLGSMVLLLSTSAQTLARPGWAGSGVTIEAWWQRAIFYRIQPEMFQDSNGDGHGDLAGIAARLSYLQSLGVDAIVLQQPFAPEGFDDLSRAAGERHLRVIVEIGSLGADPPAATEAATDEAYLNAARFWLNQGAAGLYIDTAALEGAGDERTAKLLNELRALTNSFPGERILLADAAGEGHEPVAKAISADAQLTASAPIIATGLDATNLRAQWAAAMQNTATKVSDAQPSNAPTSASTENASTNARHSRHHHAANPSRSSANASANPLLSAARLALPADTPPEQRAALNATLAAMLLLSRAAVILDYGEEIGLAASETHAAPLMQWTPSNITPAKSAETTAPTNPQSAQPAPVERRSPTNKNSPQQYGSYVPYVRPPGPSKIANAERKSGEREAIEEPAPAKVDPDTLPGFTTGHLPAVAVADATTTNVAIEDQDPRSLLNFYRRLAQLHHGSAAARNGAQNVFNHDDLNALAWLRLKPAGTATATPLLVVCNLSGKPLTISIHDDLAHLQIHGGTFRTLITTSATDIPPQDDTHIALPAYAVFVGELYR
jgi:glycosidase